MANIVIWAEIKFGEMLAAIEPEYEFVCSERGTHEFGYKKPPKQKKTLPPGVTKKESHIAQTIAANVKTAKLVMAMAEEQERLATCQEIMNEIQKRRQKMRQQEIIETPPPTGKFRTIIIDPPWPMEKILRDVRPKQDEFDYKTMPIDEIEEYPIPAADDCFLFLWTPQKFLPVADKKILESWGFQYVLTFAWYKAGGFQPVKLPQYNCEFVVFGKKGNLEFLDTKDFFTCFEGKRREHSRKPVEFYDTIRRVCPGPRANIFTREEIEGFTNFGNEKDKF
jgi:N6-adenosine-specific RNA methylase IME4